MTESSPTPLRPWRYGIHPGAKGARVQALGRVELPLGEALRLEMEGSESTAPNVVLVQYYIATEAGPWALWLSCAADDLAGNEAVLRGVDPAVGEAG